MYVLNRHTIKGEFLSLNLCIVTVGVCSHYFFSSLIVCALSSPLCSLYNSDVIDALPPASNRLQCDLRQTEFFCMTNCSALQHLQSVMYE